jgi:hypothetical protein
MLNWLRRRFGLDTLHVYPERYVMSLEHIESEIRGLKMMEELRREHGNWNGAAICRARIKEFEEYKQFLNSYGSKTLCVITKGKS